MPILRMLRVLERDVLIDMFRRGIVNDSRAETLRRVLMMSEEEGEADLVEEVETEYDPYVHSRLFSPRIVNLLSELSAREFESISSLARSLGRDVGNVYRDLKWLEGLGFVYLYRDGRRVRPRLLVVEYGLRF